MRISKILPVCLLALVFVIQACTLPAQPATPLEVTVVVTTVPTGTEPPVVVVATATPSPSPAPTQQATETPAPSGTPGATSTRQAASTSSATSAPSPTTGPQCTVLKAVNLHNGPGTAYIQILGTFAPGTVLIPTGYNPAGNPSGAWVQVKDPSKNQVGWISAAAEFVKCTIDLARLPAVAVQPPPPQAPKVSNLPAQGPKGGDIDFAVVMSSESLMRITARKRGSANDGDGIDHVLFIIQKKNNEKVYTSTERTAKFCIFAGGEPDCNPWPKSNGRYVWGSGGSVIESGDYLATIRVALKSEPTNESQWSFTITIKLP